MEYLVEQHAELDTKEQINQNNNLKKEKCDSLPNLNRTRKSNSKLLNEKKNEFNNSELYSKVTAEDLQKLCDQLSAFNGRIQTAREIIYLRYDLPNELQDKLETEASELECLHRELQDSTNNLQIIQNQRAALDNERLSKEEQISRIKSEQINELEVIVSVYDSNMMERWEAVKRENSILATEMFLHDVKGKLQAMKNLQILSTQKLTDLQNLEKKNQKKNLKKEKSRKKEERDAQTRNCLSISNFSNASQTTLPFAVDTDSEDMFEDTAVHSILYSLVCDQVLSLPAWTQRVMDLD